MIDKKRYCFDIDGTICNNTYGEYEKASPIFERIQRINELYDEGHYIIYLTARGMGTCDGNINLAYAKWYHFTFNQLSEWGCKFHELSVGEKENYDIWIDDKAFWSENFFRETGETYE